MKTGRWRVTRTICSPAVLSSALIASLATALPADAAPKRKGKVVRVERPRGLSKRVLRLCPLPLADESQGTCYGSAPAVGEVGHAYDYDGRYIGQLSVLATAPSTEFVCHHGTAFDFRYHFTPNLKGKSGASFGIAIFGLTGDPTRATLITDSSKLPNPTANKNAHPWMGMDRDGEGTADMLVSAYECTDIASLPRTPPASSEAYCLDYWTNDGRSWRKVRQDTFLTCQ